MRASDPKTPSHPSPQIDRRPLVRTAGVAALAAGGIEGILAARRAPAFAQGTKLHWVRWVDFVPESDVELSARCRKPARRLEWADGELKKTYEA